jgi:hypothetical protein
MSTKEPETLTEINLNKQKPNDGMNKDLDTASETDSNSSQGSKSSKPSSFFTQFFGSQKPKPQTTTTTSDVYTGKDELLNLLQTALTEGKDEVNLKQTNADEINKNLTELKKVKDDIIKFLTDVGKLADVTPENIDSLLNQNLWYDFDEIDVHNEDENISQYLSMQFNEQQLDNDKLAEINNTWFKKGSFGAENNYPGVAKKLTEKWTEMIKAHETNKKLQGYKTSDINDALVNQYDPNAQDFTDAMFVGLIQPNLDIQNYYPVWLKKNGYLASENLDVMPKMLNGEIETMEWIEGGIKVIKFEYFNGTQKMIGKAAKASGEALGYAAQATGQALDDFGNMSGQYLGDRGKDISKFAQEQYAEATKDEGDGIEIDAKKKLKRLLYEELKDSKFKSLKEDEQNNERLKMDQIHKAIVHLKVNDPKFYKQLYRLNEKGEMTDNDSDKWNGKLGTFPRIKDPDTLMGDQAFVNQIRQKISQTGLWPWEGQGFFGGKNKKKTIKKRPKRKGTRRR